MDVWSYLKGLRRWWWLLLLFPVVAFALAHFILIPPAKWTISWNSAIVFNGDPNAANSAVYLDYVLLDDMTHLLASDVLGDRVYANLPDDITSEYDRGEIGEMFSSYRHSRFVEITVSGDDPDVVRVVGETTREALPEAVNQYLTPPDFARIPAQISVTTLPSEPEQQTRERLIRVGGITLAGLALGFGAAGVAEWLRLSYRAKYGER
jgi:capsular polysaccharide biosynthesis protein